MIDDRYEVLEVIASGGMATVSRARDMRLDRQVAIKRPHPGPPGNDLAARMRREARAAASLSHPNLVTVYDYGSDSDGPYLVMELVEGPTLQQVSNGIEPVEVFDTGARLADGLSAIHMAGIVHRDVKPSNVIMSDRGPLLTDFGIALDPTAGDEITGPGTVVATPSYAAPEVLAGKPPSPASDVYSLAVVVDELVKGAGIQADPELEGVLAAAMSDSPGDRPDTETFARRLRGAAPTVVHTAKPAPAATGVPGGSTMILEPVPPVEAAGQSQTATRRKVLPWMTALVLGGFAVALTLIGFAASDAEPEADAIISPTTPTTASSTTTPVQETTSPTIGSTRPEGAATVSDARARLETILLATPRSDFNPPEVEDALEKLDDAVALANEGELEEAGKKLSELDEQFDEKLEATARDEARSILQSLATSLGVSIEPRGGRGDDDDD